MTEKLQDNKTEEVVKTTESSEHPKTVQELEEEVARLDACCTALNRVCVSHETDNKHLKTVVKIAILSSLVFGAAAAFAIPAAVRRGNDIKKIFYPYGKNLTSDQKVQLIEMGLNPGQLERLKKNFVSDK